MSHIGGVISIINAALSSPRRIGGICPIPLPDHATFPWITVQETISTELESMDGQSGAARSVIQVNCWSKDYDEAWELRSAVKSLLLPYSGSAGGEVIRGMNHGRDLEQYDGARQLHQLVVIFHIWWES